MACAPARSARANVRTPWQPASTASTAPRTASMISGWNRSATSDFVGWMLTSTCAGGTLTSTNAQ